MTNVIYIEEWKKKKEDVLGHTLDTRLFRLQRPHLSYFELCNIWDDSLNREIAIGTDASD